MHLLTSIKTKLITPFLFLIVFSTLSSWFFLHYQHKLSSDYVKYEALSTQWQSLFDPEQNANIPAIDIQSTAALTGQLQFFLQNLPAQPLNIRLQKLQDHLVQWLEFNKNLNKEELTVPPLPYPGPQTVKTSAIELGYLINGYNSTSLMLTLKTMLVAQNDYFLDRNNQHLNAIKTQYLELLQKVKSSNIIETDQENIGELIESYATLLEQYQKTKRNKQQVIAQSKNIENYLETLHVVDLVADYYLIRHYADDTIEIAMQKKPYLKQKKQFDNKLEKILNNIQYSSIDSKKKQILSDSLNYYAMVLNQHLLEIKRSLDYQEKKQLFTDTFIKILADSDYLLNNYFDQLHQLKLQEMQKIKHAYLIFNSIIILACLLFYFLVIIKSIIKPLKYFNQASKQHNQINNRKPIIFNSNDEFGDLATSFNYIIDNLNKKSEDLLLVIDASKNREEEKRNFVATISHEIRTPLNGMIGMSYLAQQSNTDIKVQSYLDSIFRSANVLLKIVNDVLDYSKIESSKLDIHNSTFDISELLDNIIGSVALYAEEKGLTFLLQLAPQLPQFLIGDMLRIQQVLVNLCNNSIKFTPKGKVILQINLVKKTQSECEIKFTVLDQGPGLSQEQIDQIFIPFTQGDNSTTRKFGGTGLGLSISQELVELMGGQIRVGSKVDIGSKFTFSLNMRFSEKNSTPVQHTYMIFSSEKTVHENIHRNLANPKNVIIKSDNAAYTYQLLSETLFDWVIFDWQDVGIDVNSRRIIAEALNKTHAFIFLISSIKGINTLKVFFDKLKLEHQQRIKIHNKPFNPFHLQNKEQPTQHHITSEHITKQLAITGKALVIEDDLINQQVVFELLKSFGMHVELASDGREGVNKAQSFIPDIILVDIEMPGMNGYQTTRELRQMAQFEHTPIVALSGNDVRNDDIFTQSGLTDSLLKPLDPGHMHQMLKKWLEVELKERQMILADQQDEFSVLTSFNYHEGLQRVAGKRPLYKQLLAEFSQNYKEAKLVLEMLIQAQDFIPATRYCHKMKGVCSNLGNDELYNTLCLLENAFSKEVIIDSNFLQFSTQLQQTFSELELLFANHNELNAPEHDNTTQPDDKQSILTRLQQLLDEADGEVLDLFNEQESMIRDLFTDNDFQLLYDALNSFEFEKAQTIIQHYQYGEQ